MFKNSKFELSIIVLIFVGLMVEAVASCQKVVDISSNVAAKLVENMRDNPNFIILDIRTTEEFNKGHIEGAVSLDFYKSDFAELINQLDKSKDYLIYCRTGTRSSRAVDMAMAFGFKRIYHLIFGINEWLFFHLPIVR